MERARCGQSDRLRDLDLVALALERLQHVPVREGVAEAFAQLVLVPRKRIQVLVVRRKDGGGTAERVAQLLHRGDEPRLVGDRIGRADRECIGGAEADGEVTVVDGDDGYAGAAERANRTQ